MLKAEEIIPAPGNQARLLREAFVRYTQTSDFLEAILDSLNAQAGCAFSPASFTGWSFDVKEKESKLVSLYGVLKNKGWILHIPCIRIEHDYSIEIGLEQEPNVEYLSASVLFDSSIRGYFRLIRNHAIAEV